MIPTKFKQEYGWIETEDGEMVATFPENTPQKIRRLLTKAPELFTKMHSFVERVKNGGSLKPKATVIEFEELLKQIEE